VQVRQRAVALVEVEAVADEELVRDDEADVADGQVVDEAAVRPVEQGDDGERARLAQRERLAEEAQRQSRVDDVLDQQDVAAADLGVQVLQEPDPARAARLRLGAVAGELDEVERVRDRDRAREVGDEDERRLQRRDEQRLAAGVVPRDLASELADTRRDLGSGEVDLTDAWILVAVYEAIRSLNRLASRATSRL
jgi:hypothetical protein